MKKKDIIKVLNAVKTINNLKEILSYTKYERPFEPPLAKDEKYWLPNIKGLESQLETLKKEIRNAQEENDKALNDLKPCTHEVRISTYEDLGIGDTETHKCVLCGKYIAKPRKNNWYENTNAVVIKNKEQFDGDYWYSYEKGMSKKEIMNIITNILNKYNDEDEIDLIKEFANLSLENKDINIYDQTKNNHKFILIIGGSNINILEGDSKYYLTKDISDISIKFLKHFSNILNTKIVLIDRQETIKKAIFDEYRKNDWIILKPYEYLEEIEKELTLLKNTPFKIIIDLSDFYKLNISDNQIKEERYPLNLKQYFPNSEIFEITEKQEYMDVCHKVKKLLK